MKKLRKILTNKKLRNKLLASYLLACLIPLLLTTMIIYHFSVKNLEEESMELAVLYSSQIVTNIDRFAEEYDRITKSILVDNDTLADISAADSPSVSEKINSQLLVRKLLMRIAVLRPNVDNIMLLTTGGGFYQYSNSGASVSRQLLEEQEWMKSLLDSRQVLTVTGAHLKTYYDSQQDGIAVTIGRRLYNTAGIETGILLIDISPFELVEMNDNFKLTRSNYNIRIHVSSDGETLYDSDVIDGKATWRQVMEAEADVQISEKENIIIRDTAHRGTLQVEAVIPRKQLMGKADSITLVSAVAIGCSILLIIGLSFILSGTITRPITQLQQKLVALGEGSYTRLEGFQSSDEIGTLIENYNRMVEKIKSLINDVYLAQIKQKDAKLMALRTQINPHMLYNTLESIRMNALMKGDTEVADMIKILAKMFRASLGMEDGGHTIRAELEYVENYILLQNIRFQGQFDFQYEVEEGLLDAGIVPLVFQPIVENCIEHGNRGNYRKLHIFLRCSRASNSSVCVTFRDDGQGMTAERMEQINRQLRSVGTDTIETEGDGGSIGLRNIAERIYLRYGSEYYLRIVESGDEGTVIEMKIHCNAPEGSAKGRQEEVCLQYV